MITKRFLHLDLDCFFVSVEELHDATLQGQPVAVGGKPEERGVVASASYGARVRGIRSAMPMAQAVRLCPDLIIVPPHFDRYQHASRQVMTYLQSISPAFEQRSIDEAVLRIEMIALSEMDLARQIQATIREVMGLPCSLGIAGGKQIAKIAADAGKKSATPGQPPNAIMRVAPGQDAAFLAPLPIDDLFGVGPRTAQRMRSLGIKTIGDLARRQDSELRHHVGRWGVELSALSRGLDRSDVETSRQRQSVSHEHTFSHDVTDRSVLEQIIRSQALAVSRRLRASGWQGKVVRLKLRWASFETVTRQASLAEPTSDDDVIAHAAMDLFQHLWQPGQSVRLVGVGLDQIGLLERQLSLWDPQAAERLVRDAALQETIARLKQRFGDDAIQWGNMKRKRDEHAKVTPSHHDPD